MKEAVYMQLILLVVLLLITYEGKHIIIQMYLMSFSQCSLLKYKEMVSEFNFQPTTSILYCRGSNRHN